MPSEPEIFLTNAQHPLPQQHYLASPYTAKTPEASADYAEAARQASVVLRQQGYIVYCPLLAGNHPLPTGWYHYDLGHLRDCKAGLLVLTLPGWQKSHGIQLEMAAALSLERPITMLQPEGLVDHALLSKIGSQNTVPPQVTIAQDGVATVASKAGHAVSTQKIKDAFAAGASPQQLARDNSTELECIHDAIRYELG